MVLSKCVTLHKILFSYIAGSGGGDLITPPTTSVTIPTSVTISSGELVAPFNVNITDDTIQEENETFSITFDLPSSCLPVTVNGDHSFTITIIDDEGNDIPVCCVCCYM